MQVGPDCTWVKSSTLMPSSALPAWPQGLVDGFGRPFGAAGFAATLAAGFFGASLHDLLAVRLLGRTLVFADGFDVLAFVRIAIVVVPFISCAARFAD